MSTTTTTRRFVFVIGLLLLLACSARGQGVEEVPFADLTPLELELYLTDDDPRTRETAAREVGRRGEAAREIMNALIAALSDEEPSVRQAVVDSMLAIGLVPGDEATSRLSATKRHERLEAARALRFIGSAAAASSDDLIRVVSNEGEDPDVRAEAALALASVGGPADEVVSVLRRGLQDSVERLRFASVHALFGLEDRGVSEILSELAVPQHARSRSTILTALREVSLPSTFVAPLTGMLRDQDVHTRTLAAWALASAGPLAAPSVPELVRANERGTISDAAVALREIARRARSQNAAIWWVVPLTYRGLLTGALGIVVFWTLVIRRVSRCCPPGRRGIAFLAAAVPGVSVSVGAVAYVMTRDWAQPFLPDSVPIVALPPVIAVSSSAALCALLLSGWACSPPPGSDCADSLGSSDPTSGPERTNPRCRHQPGTPQDARLILRPPHSSAPHAGE